MITRRRLLSLLVGSAALLALRELVARAQPPPTHICLPLIAAPSSDPGLIIAPASGLAGPVIAWFAARAVGYTTFDITSIVQVYQSLGEKVGVDWFLALAQCGHETGSLTSWWSQRPRRNPAGIGVTGKVVPGDSSVPPGEQWAWDESLAQWREGLSFVSWAEVSIPAHLGRLLAYALPEGDGTPEQQALIGYALDLRPLPAAYRGAAPTITGLNGRWAYPGATYGESILDLARRMREAQ